MSSYIHKQAIRYRFPKEKTEQIKEMIWDSTPFENDHLFEYDIGLDWNSGEEEVYLDKVYCKEYDEMTADFTKSRLLTDKEIEHHLKDFQKYDPNITADDLRAVEYCYYNGVDAPACFDCMEGDQDWLF